MRYTWFVKDNLWRKQGLKADDFVCWTCFETRLGRPIGVMDMTGGSYVPISRHRWRSELKSFRAGQGDPMLAALYGSRSAPLVKD
jgi:hypothetical protein